MPRHRRSEYLVLRKTIADRGALRPILVLCGTGIWAILLIAVLALLPFPVATDDPRPWRVLVHLTPFTDVLDDPAGMLLNILLFVPLGMLLPLVTGVRTVRRAAAVGLLVSVAIEAVQLAGVLVVGTGRIADVDDLVGNALGTAIGWTACVLLMQLPPLGRLAARASWAEDGIASGAAPGAAPATGG